MAKNCKAKNFKTKDRTGLMNSERRFHKLLCNSEL